MDRLNEENKTGMAELHQYCTKYKLEHPCYKIMEVTDLINNKIFIVQCILKDQIETRIGKNKRQGKNLAAHYLLEKLKYHAIFCCKDYVNDSDEGSLEEGEIDDREEGEIIEVTTNKKYENKTDNKDHQKNIEINDDILFYENKIAQYRSKKVYLEGNVKNNNINFVNNLQNKTQLQLLAEFCFENKLPSPIYEINENMGLTKQIYTCKCSVLELGMKTSGLSKEDVKERSSKMLLEKMKKHINILRSSDEEEKKIVKNELEEGEIVDNMSHHNGCNNDNSPENRRKRKKLEKNESTDRNSLFLHNVHSMNDLYNYCLKQQIPPPVYNLLQKKHVAPNKKIFKMQCSVLKFSKISYGLNKRQAQCKAARLVLEKLQDWKRNVQDRESDLEEGEVTEKDEQVKQEYMKRRMENNYISRNEKNLLQLESISDRHNLMKKSKPYTECKTLNSLKTLDDSDIKDKVDVTLLLNKICEEMDITYDIIDFKSDLNSMVSIFINSVPPWSTFGVGKIKEEAKLDGIRKMIKFFKEMIKN